MHTHTLTHIHTNKHITHQGRRNSAGLLENVMCARPNVKPVGSSHMYGVSMYDSNNNDACMCVEHLCDDTWCVWRVYVCVMTCVCMMYDMCRMMCDVCCMMYDVWCMMYDVWCMMYDVWCMMYDVLCMMYDILCMMHDVWYMMGAHMMCVVCVCLLCVCVCVCVVHVILLNINN